MYARAKRIFPSEVGQCETKDKFILCVIETIYFLSYKCIQIIIINTKGGIDATRCFPIIIGVFNSQSVYSEYSIFL